jgi:hypothetical protein
MMRSGPGASLRTIRLTAGKRRGKRNAAVLRANAEWERGQAGGFDPATFENAIAPKLATTTLAEMMLATGLSRPYCALIRRGVRVPHARHWEVLRALVNQAPKSDLSP